jgi:hypothetical protein
MAPENTQKIVVLDLAIEEENRIVATRHTAGGETTPEFLVKWYPLKEAPKGFQAVAGGVLYVPEWVPISEEEDIDGLDCTPQRCKYEESTDMLVLLLPEKTTLSWLDHPKAAKESRGRLAVYWFRASPGETVAAVWSLHANPQDARQLAQKINAFIGDELGERPLYSIDDYEHYDVVLSYASEDRAYAEDLAQRLRAKGCQVFYDHDTRARLWGKELETELHNLYSKRATYCVALVSKHYTEKKWPRRELKAALDGQVRNRRADYILPVKIDGTRLQELPGDLAYLGIEEGVESICKTILEMLAKG